MNNREVRKKCSEVMRHYDYAIVPYTLKYCHDSQCVSFKCVSKESGAVFRIFVDFECCHATKQMMGAVTLHEERNIDYMFFD